MVELAAESHAQKSTYFAFGLLGVFRLSIGSGWSCPSHQRHVAGLAGWVSLLQFVGMGVGVAEMGWEGLRRVFRSWW